MGQIAKGVHIVETTAGIKRWYAQCDEHPEWHPGSDYTKSKAIGDAEFHSRDVHDGIDYEGMPNDLVTALRQVRDVDLRRLLARQARTWANRQRLPEPPYFQCRDCSYDTYGEDDFGLHALKTGHALDADKD